VGLDPRGARLVKTSLGTWPRRRDDLHVHPHPQIVEAMCTRVAIINKGEIIAGEASGSWAGWRGWRHSHLEPIFLKLTGDDETV